jgi:hypothetical protein
MAMTGNLELADGAFSTSGNPRVFEAPGDDPKAGKLPR